jgi:hypothetical protein
VTIYASTVTQRNRLGSLEQHLASLQAEFNTSEHALYARGGIPEALHELNVVGYQLERVKRQIAALRAAEPMCEVAR